MDFTDNSVIIVGVSARESRTGGRLVSPANFFFFKHTMHSNWSTSRPTFLTRASKHSASH
jgi:hypothetical protein